MKNSVVDLNTINFDPDPEFWSNLYLDPVLYYHFLKKKISFKKFKQLAPEDTYFKSDDSLNVEFISSILHLLSLIYPNLDCVDPDP